MDIYQNTKMVICYLWAGEDQTHKRDILQHSKLFLYFLKDPKIDSEVKKHTKLLVGAGVWENDARDYTWVQDIIRQLAN